jgi:hypothetical protein
MITVLMTIRSGFAADAVNAHGRSFTDIGAIWLWVGILGGGCVGILRPLVRSTLRTAFIGAIAGVLLHVDLLGLS